MKSYFHAEILQYFTKQVVALDSCFTSVKLMNGSTDLSYIDMSFIVFLIPQ